jgi:hypothetical protein
VVRVLGLIRRGMRRRVSRGEELVFRPACGSADWIVSMRDPQVWGFVRWPVDSYLREFRSARRVGAGGGFDGPGHERACARSSGDSVDVARLENYCFAQDTGTVLAR